MWTCSHCGEENEPNFDICWNCQWGKDGSPPTDVAELDEQDQEDVEFIQQINQRSASVINNTATTARTPTKSVRSSNKPGEYEYLVYPFHGEVVGRFSESNIQRVSKQLQGVIDQYANEGWDFHSIEKVNIRVSPGCLAGLLGVPEQVIPYDQIIFRRPTTQGATKSPSTRKR